MRPPSSIKGGQLYDLDKNKGDLDDLCKPSTGPFVVGLPLITPSQRSRGRASTEARPRSRIFTCLRAWILHKLSALPWLCCKWTSKQPTQAYSAIQCSQMPLMGKGELLTSVSFSCLDSFRRMLELHTLTPCGCITGRTATALSTLCDTYKVSVHSLGSRLRALIRSYRPRSNG